MSVSLQLSSDILYATAAKALLEQRLKEKSWAADGVFGESAKAPESALDRAKCDWDSTEGLETSFFEKLLKITSKIKNVQTALACAYGIVRELPMGRLKLSGD